MLTTLIAAFPFPPAVAQDLALTAPRAAEEAPKWEFSLSAFYVDPPGEGAHGTTVLYADRGQLHLEARHNYEDLDTVSLFAGWTIRGGEEVEASITPMIGGVFGDTNGVAPGLLLDVSWSKLEFYAESEYLFDTDDSDENFFYTWSTLMWRFSPAFGAGLVAERTRIVETGLEVQRGLALQVMPGPLGFSLYAYNPASEDAYYTLSVDFAF